MQVKTYITNSLKTLVPVFEVPQNPITLLRLLNRQQTTFFLVAFSAWTLSSFGLFIVPLNIAAIATTYNRSTVEIASVVTITLMSRCLGAFLFGAAGDRFGRKWPFILNIVLCATAGIITGCCQSYKQFFIIRALYGIAMGGIYGNSAAIALEDAPVAARGFLSGFSEAGYTFGTLLASALNPLIIHNQPYGWRAVFWFASCLGLFIAFCHAFLPETQAYLSMTETRDADNQTSNCILFPLTSVDARLDLFSNI